MTPLPSPVTDTNHLALLRFMMIMVQVLTLLLSGILTTWVWNQNSRQMQTELMVQELRTWRESARPADASDHEQLMKLAQEVAQRSVTLEQVVGLLRDMKNLVESLGAQQITIREGVTRLEDTMLRWGLNGSHPRRK